MIPVLQKTPDYCFVACLASALLDEGCDKLQDLIVNHFPDELKRSPPQKIGVPSNWQDNEKIFKGLGLASKVTFEQPSAKQAIDFLKNQTRTPQRIFINTNGHGGGFHCVRLYEVRDEGVTIMDPIDGRFKKWSWPEFETQYYALVVRSE
jgi:ABC-type bacteriocin/lantibiotic exporter with double-glycine peptidase domain